MDQIFYKTCKDCLNYVILSSYWCKFIGPLVYNWTSLLDEWLEDSACLYIPGPSTYIVLVFRRVYSENRNLDVHIKWKSAVLLQREEIVKVCLGFLSLYHNIKYKKLQLGTYVRIWIKFFRFVVSLAASIERNYLSK